MFSISLRPPRKQTTNKITLIAISLILASTSCVRSQACGSYFDLEGPIGLAILYNLAQRVSFRAMIRFDHKIASRHIGRPSEFPYFDYKPRPAQDSQLKVLLYDNMVPLAKAVIESLQCT